MRFPRDRKTRINIFFISPFVLTGLIFVGLNLYKNLHYATFTLTVSSDYQLSRSSNGFITKRTPINPTLQTNNQTTYSHLHTYWWADRTNIYTLGTIHSGLWFRVHSTLNGNYYIVPGDWGSRAEISNIKVTNSNGNGNTVDELQPDKWYEVNQYGGAIKLKLRR